MSLFLAILFVALAGHPYAALFLTFFAWLEHS